VVADDGSELLSESFWAVARRLRGLSRQTLAPWEISPSHSRALIMLLRHEKLRLSELSERLHIAARSATEVVDGLAERGLAERRPDPTDRRATLVVLTDQGKQAAAAIQRARTDEAERFFGALSETDRRHLARILRTLTR
jgi:DNA-binding MarR family transcriptional regulator